MAVSAVALLSTASVAMAGGYAVREQSASLLGSAFAGAAAGGDLSSAFWNPAAFSVAKDGLSIESHYSLITADTELSNGRVDGVDIGFGDSTSIDELGYLGSTYAAFRLNDKTVLGISSGAPFGLKTKPDNEQWNGAPFGRAADMLTFNVSPTVAYDIAPGVTIAAGLQLQYMKLKLWTAAGASPAAPNLKVSLDDSVGVGYTAGVLLRPAPGTSIGLGFRSKIEQELEGKNYVAGNLFSDNVRADLETPEIVTLSIIQSVTPSTRLLGTVEWTNWSRLGVVPVTGLVVPTGLPPPAPGLVSPDAAVIANWDDGWFFSGGLEYDYSPVLTLRGGVAYEKSPIQDPEQRLLPLPDSDRWWLSVGATYQYSENTTFDFGYSHVIFEDASLSRHALTDVGESGAVFTADVDNRANIFSIGMKSKLDWILSGH